MVVFAVSLHTRKLLRFSLYAYSRTRVGARLGLTPLIRSGILDAATIYMEHCRALQRDGHHMCRSVPNVLWNECRCNRTRARTRADACARFVASRRQRSHQRHHRWHCRR